MNQVAAVVVTYNRKNMLLQCLQALRGQSRPCDILVVDNASTDDTEAEVREAMREDPAICYHRMEKNQGGAGGFSFGVRWAAERGYPFIWLMDDDCFPEPEALEALLEADTALHGDYGWLSSVALWTDGHECRMNRQKAKKSFWDYSELLKYGLLQAEQATFVSLFLRACVVQQVGLPIKDFFIWGDDIEYTRRIAVRQGRPSFIAGKSRVVHAMAQNSGSNLALDVSERIDRYRYAYRNENYTYRQEGAKGICYYLARCGKHGLEVLLHAKDHRLKRLWVLGSSMVRGIGFAPKVEYLNAAQEDKKSIEGEAFLC